jgi:hypothetical protein
VPITDDLGELEGVGVLAVAGSGVLQVRFVGPAWVISEIFVLAVDAAFVVVACRPVE